MESEQRYSHKCFDLGFVVVNESLNCYPKKDYKIREKIIKNNRENNESKKFKKKSSINYKNILGNYNN